MRVICTQFQSCRRRNLRGTRAQDSRLSSKTDTEGLSVKQSICQPVNLSVYPAPVSQSWMCLASKFDSIIMVPTKYLGMSSLYLVPTWVFKYLGTEYTQDTTY